MVTQHIVLDMTPGTKPVVNVSQYDTGARTLVFHLRQNRQTFTPPEGCTAIIHGIKPDSTYFSYAAEIDGDTVIADCTEQMTAVPGFAECEIKITNTEGRVGSCNFRLLVEKSPETGAIISDTDIPVFEQLTDRAEQAASSATASATVAAESAEQAGASATNAGESADRAAREAETASQAAEEAGESATAAANSASSASGSEASARGFAEQAEQSANDASESAQGAAQAAQTASAKASEAAASADRASGSAVDSATAANLASGYADTAQAQAQAAGESATNAAGSASTASQAAATATTKAGEASDSATAADTSAGQAASSASAASASAGTASEKATQAGESATNAANSASAAAGSASDASDSAAAALESERAAAQSASDIAASAAQIQTNTDNIAALQIVESTEAADITSIDDGADGVPMKSLKVYIEPVQEGSGDPSPDNIRPISGWDSVETVRTGVNQWDEEWERANVNWTTYIFTPQDNGGRISPKNYIPVIPGETYYYNGDRSIAVMCGYTNDNGDGGRPLVINTSTKSFTIPNDVHYIKFGVAVTSYGTTYNHDISINYPSTDTAYHPYEGRTITADLPSTVYGGVLDVISGVLTVDRAMVDLGTLNWNYQAASGNMYADGALQNRLAHGASICSIYAKNEVDEISGVGGLTTNDRYALQHNYTSRIIIRDTDYTDAASFKAAVAGQTLVYELATPTAYTLTPEEVKTLLKQNSVFADAGQTAIVYVADPKTYIDNFIADAVASLT